MLRFLTGRSLGPLRRGFLSKFCRVVLPGRTDGFPEPSEMAMVDRIERYVAGLHPLHRFGIALLLDALNLLPLLLGRFLPAMWLPDAAMRAYLRRLESSRLYAVRNGFAATKALAMLVYYGDTRVEAGLGYEDECLLSSPEAR